MDAAFHAFVSLNEELPLRGWLLLNAAEACLTLTLTLTLTLILTLTLTLTPRRRAPPTSASGSPPRS